MEQLEQLKQAKKELATAFEKLNDLWLDAESQESEALAEDYPFEKDFNELTQDVKTWAKK